MENAYPVIKRNQHTLRHELGLCSVKSKLFFKKENILIKHLYPITFLLAQDTLHQVTSSIPFTLIITFLFSQMQSNSV